MENETKPKRKKKDINSAESPTPKSQPSQPSKPIKAKATAAKSKPKGKAKAKSGASACQPKKVKKVHGKKAKTQKQESQNASKSKNVDKKEMTKAEKKRKVDAKKNKPVPPEEAEDVETPATEYYALYGPEHAEDGPEHAEDVTRKRKPPVQVPLDAIAGDGLVTPSSRRRAVGKPSDQGATQPAPTSPKAPSAHDSQDTVWPFGRNKCKLLQHMSHVQYISYYIIIYTCLKGWTMKWNAPSRAPLHIL